jgi:hypothetical protein
MMIFKTACLNDSARYGAKKKASVEYRGSLIRCVNRVRARLNTTLADRTPR